MVQQIIHFLFPGNAEDVVNKYKGLNACIQMNGGTQYTSLFELCYSRLEAILRRGITIYLPEKGWWLG